MGTTNHRSLPRRVAAIGCGGLLVVLVGCNEEIMQPPSDPPTFALGSGPAEEAETVLPMQQANRPSDVPGPRRPTSFPCNTSVLMASTGFYRHLSVEVAYPRFMVQEARGRVRRVMYQREDENGTITRMARCVVPDHPGAPAIALWEFSVARLERAMAQRENGGLLLGASAGGLAVSSDADASVQALADPFDPWDMAGMVTSSSKDDCNPEVQSCADEAWCMSVNGTWYGEEGFCVAMPEGFLVEVYPSFEGAYCGPGFHWTGSLCAADEPYGNPDPDPSEPDPPGGGAPDPPPGVPLAEACGPLLLVRGSEISCAVEPAWQDATVEWTFYPAGGSAGALEERTHTGTTWSGAMVWGGVIVVEVYEVDILRETEMFEIEVSPRNWTIPVSGTSGGGLSGIGDEPQAGPGAGTVTWGANVSAGGAPGHAPAGGHTVGTVPIGPNAGYGYVQDHGYALTRTYWVNQWLKPGFPTRNLYDPWTSAFYNPYDAEAQLYGGTPSLIIDQTADHEMFGANSHQARLQYSVQQGCGNIAQAVEGVVAMPSAMVSLAGNAEFNVGQWLEYEASHSFVHGMVSAHAVLRIFGTSSPYRHLVVDNMHVDVPTPTQPCNP